MVLIYSRSSARKFRFRTLNQSVYSEYVTGVFRNSTLGVLFGFLNGNEKQSWHFYSGNEWKILPNKTPMGCSDRWALFRKFPVHITSIQVHTKYYNKFNISKDSSKKPSVCNTIIMRVTSLYNTIIQYNCIFSIIV